MHNKLLARAVAVKIIEMTAAVSFLSIGVSLGIIAGLGQTTSTSTSSAIAGALGIKVGNAMFLLYFIFLLLQLFVMKKDFTPLRLLQIIPIATQAVILNYFRYDFPPFQKLDPQGYPLKFLTFFIGMLLISLGFTLLKYTYFVNYPPEAFCGVIADKLKIKFGTVKIFLDFVYVAASVLICLIARIEMDMLSVGTLIFAVCNGMLINFYTAFVRRLHAAFERKLLDGYTAKLLPDGRFGFYDEEGQAAF